MVVVISKCFDESVCDAGPENRFSMKLMKKSAMSDRSTSRPDVDGVLTGGYAAASDISGREQRIVVYYVIEITVQVTSTQLGRQITLAILAEHYTVVESAKSRLGWDIDRLDHLHIPGMKCRANE